MLKRYLSLTLIGLMLSLMPDGQALAQPSTNNQTQVEKTKEKIAKLGVGEKARVQIKLRDGKKMKGYIASVGTDDFRLAEPKAGLTTTIAYSDVVEAHKPGLSTGAKIAIIVGIPLVAIGVILAVAVAKGLPKINLSM